MKLHSELLDYELRSKIRTKEIYFAGNRRLKIYGLLNCGSGKTMKRENRVFFRTIEEAISNNYRPCGICMKQAYQIWRNENGSN